ncbi:hypothetical protein RND81_11G115900 [Saponaria officinalis]|uniref:Uncharacterized protein n=1 Tax=Saponaria officinalis TaxID=3572 RepID=A0AAW1HL56_SAPOF
MPQVYGRDLQACHVLRDRFICECETLCEKCKTRDVRRMKKSEELYEAGRGCRVGDNCKVKCSRFVIHFAIYIWSSILECDTQTFPNQQKKKNADWLQRYLTAQVTENSSVLS